MSIDVSSPGYTRGPEIGHGIRQPTRGTVMVNRRIRQVHTDESADQLHVQHGSSDVLQEVQTTVDSSDKSPAINASDYEID